MRTGALIGTVGGVGLSVSQWSRLEAQCEDKRPTGLQNLNRALSKKHRVGLCDWPIKGCRELGDARVRTLDALFEHVVSSGYDGVELSVDMTRELYPEVFSNRSDWYVAQALRRSAERRGSRILGCLYLVVDGMDPIRPFDLDMADPDFLNALEAKLRADRLAGSEYCTFQVCLPKKYLNTGGSYRGDVNYYAKTAARMQAIQKVCHRLGLNCYFETHVDRISEDPVAFADILNVSDAIGPPVEVNGDLSHYLYRSITKGPAVEAVLMRLGHTHQRMAREHGDLSVDVVDPRADWETKGVTWKVRTFRTIQTTSQTTSLLLNFLFLSLSLTPFSFLSSSF